MISAAGALILVSAEPEGERMPSFYFKNRASDGVFDTPEADHYPSLEAARRDALAGAKEMVAAALKSGAPLSVALDHAFDIVDDNGKVVAAVTFEEAVEADLR